MANDCWNKASLKGDEATLQKLYEKFTSSTNGIFSMTNYKNLFEGDVSDMDEEDFGSKRFTPSCDLVDGELIITGDSAWAPMIGLFETICAEYGVEGQLEYDEQGYDFAGKIKWDSTGDVVSLEEWTYWEAQLINDPTNFWEEMSWRYDSYDTFEELVENFQLHRWKDQTILNLDKLIEGWNNHCDED
jgi:hypothetical protein